MFFVSRQSPCSGLVVGCGQGGCFIPTFGPAGTFLMRLARRLPSSRWRWVQCEFSPLYDLFGTVFLGPLPSTSLLPGRDGRSGSLGHAGTSWRKAGRSPASFHGLVSFAGARWGVEEVQLPPAGTGARGTTCRCLKGVSAGSQEGFSGQDQGRGCRGPRIPVLGWSRASAIRQQFLRSCHPLLVLWPGKQTFPEGFGLCLLTVWILHQDR